LLRNIPAPKPRARMIVGGMQAQIAAQHFAPSGFQPNARQRLRAGKERAAKP
jgi:hypothetical protein